ncbi:hypothetical protein [Lonepinella sp. BR2357]|uniref:hypothetical protein n=1 Tax=Lonepinella sp. BR2357 TaxID=3434549 RepID=UPI003F6DC4CB
MKMKKNFFISLGAAIVLAGVSSMTYAIENIELNYPKDLQTKDYYSKNPDKAKEVLAQCEPIAQREYKSIEKQADQIEDKFKDKDFSFGDLNYFEMLNAYQVFAENCANAGLSLLTLELPMPTTFDEKTSDYDVFKQFYGEKLELKVPFVRLIHNSSLFFYQELYSDKLDRFYQKYRIAQNEFERANLRKQVSAKVEQEIAPFKDLNWQQGIAKLISVLMKPNDRSFSLDYWVETEESELNTLDYVINHTDFSGSTRIDDRIRNNVRHHLYNKFYFTGLKELLAKPYLELIKDTSYCQTDRRPSSACSVYNKAVEKQQNQLIENYMKDFDSLKKDYNQCVAQFEAHYQSLNVDKKAETIPREAYDSIVNKEKEIFQSYPCNLAQQALQNLNLSFSHIDKLD